MEFKICRRECAVNMPFQQKCWERVDEKCLRPANQKATGNPNPGRGRQGNPHGPRCWKTQVKPHIDRLFTVMDEPDVAKGLVMLLSDHPPFPLEVSVNREVEMEVV